MRRPIVFIFFFFQLLVECYSRNFFDTPQTYTLKDLQALKETNNFKEFFDHSKDVRPSLRSKEWESLITFMANKYIDSFDAKKIEEDEFAYALKVFKYAHLDFNEMFRDKRNLFIKKYLSNLIEEQPLSTSIKKTKYIFRSLNFYGDFGIQVLDLIYPKLSSSDVALNKDFFWALVRKTVSGKFSEFYCHKDGLNKFLKFSLYQKFLQKSDLHKDCFTKIVPTIKEDLYHSNLAVRGDAFNFLKKMKMLTSIDISKYHFTNLVLGKKYQLSEWEPVIKAIKHLGDDFNKRAELLAFLDRLDPYPDNLFSQYEEKQLIALTRLISKNFPEYLDKYTSQCLNFLSGKEKFKNGNPTPNCHDYMKVSKKSKSTPENVLKRYDVIMNSWKAN